MQVGTLVNDLAIAFGIALFVSMLWLIVTSDVSTQLPDDHDGDKLHPRRPR
jgi:hypothetical protein